MQFKTGTQIIGASRVKLAVIFRKQDINIIHTIISQAKGMGGNRSARTQKLESKCLGSLLTLRQFPEKTNNPRSISFLFFALIPLKFSFKFSAFQSFRISAFQKGLLVARRRD